MDISFQGLTIRSAGIYEKMETAKHHAGRAILGMNEIHFPIQAGTSTCLELNAITNFTPNGIK